MTLVNQSASRPRVVGRWGVLGLLLQLAATLGWSEVASATTLQTINLNTGYDQWSNLPIAVGQQDNEWRVTSLPLNGGPTFVVDDAIWVNFNTNLPTSFPTSRWISINTTATPLSPAPSSYKYEFYFTLPPGFSAPQLKMALSSDDHITGITLNTCPLFAGPSGGIFNKPPLVLPATAPALTCFNSGSKVNVITVTVEDTASVITGLIVDGTATYEDCDRLPVRQIPGLSTITFWESTVAMAGLPTPHVALPTILGAKLTVLDSSSNDFQGVHGAELYDVFYSDWDGTFNPNGEFVTIEAVWPVGAPAGGGLNIAKVDFNGTNQYANSVASFVALGSNALPLGVGTAVDGNLLTDTTMGSTSNQTERLRVTVGSPCPCAPRPSSMVAWWPMNDVTGAPIVDDIVGTHDGNPKPNGLVGSPDGPDPVSGKVGGALRYLFSPNRYAEVTNAPGLNFGNGPFSIDAWINTDMGTQTEPIVDKIGALLNATSGYSLSIQGSNNVYKLTLGIGIGNTVQFLQGPQITAGQWNYVAVTVDPTGSPPTATLYVGNATSGFNALNGNIGSANTTNTLDLLIGYNPSNPHVDIMIDELEVFNRALSRQEIQSIFLADSAGKCRVTGVQIDIKPGSFPNAIKPRSRWLIPVAILTTSTFDATTVDPVMIRFGRIGTAAPVQSALRDADGDGDTDLILRFEARQSGIQCGDTTATLTGRTFDGQAIEGSDSIKTVWCKLKRFARQSNLNDTSNGARGSTRRSRPRRYGAL